ncbi:CDP-alcohol phosphatidyltransferase family protein [Mobilicoccus caccae]|uniref:CDP-alcohol phosphatidyltransferase family protein n=1 Tax=Mobilicoccus caccae TaxID=1859295 RepID=UPI003D66C324
MLRILLVPLFLWLLLRHGGHDVGDRWWAFAVFVAAMITDRLDGELARRKGLITDFGRMADPIADKALTGAGFIGLSLIGLLWWWVTIVVLAREIGITLMRFVVIRYGVMPAGKGASSRPSSRPSPSPCSSRRWEECSSGRPPRSWVRRSWSPP